MKIVVLVEGGCLRNVYCDEDAEVELIDLDSELDVDDEDALNAKKEEVENHLADIEADMIEVF